jgi:hypothetical protein
MMVTQIHNLLILLTPYRLMHLTLPNVSKHQDPPISSISLLSNFILLYSFLEPRSSNLVPRSSFLVPRLSE